MRNRSSSEDDWEVAYQAVKGDDVDALAGVLNRCPSLAHECFPVYPDNAPGADHGDTADVDSPSWSFSALDGRPLFHAALQWKAHQSSELLLQRGAAIDAATSDTDVRSVEIAILQRDRAMIARLLALGARLAPRALLRPVDARDAQLLEMILDAAPAAAARAIAHREISRAAVRAVREAFSSVWASTAETASRRKDAIDWLEWLLVRGARLYPPEHSTLSMIDDDRTRRLIEATSLGARRRST